MAMVIMVMVAVGRTKMSCIQFSLPFGRRTVVILLFLHMVLCFVIVWLLFRAVRFSSLSVFVCTFVYVHVPV